VPGYVGPAPLSR